MIALVKSTKKATYHHGDLRSALLQQAVLTIGTAGAANLSLRDLAAQLGVSHAAVYRHFGDKAALMEAVAIHGFELLEAAVAAAGAGLDGDPVQQLASQGAAYVGLAVHHPGHFAAMFAPQAPLQPANSAVQAAANRAYQLLVDTVMRHLRASDGQQAGVQAEALRCWALVHGLACLHLSGHLQAQLAGDASLQNSAGLQAVITNLLMPGSSKK